MKKRVRIYKPTNKFKQGGVQQQYSPDQLITVYMSALSQPGSSVDTAENALRQLQRDPRIDENTIAQVSEAAQTYITEQQDAHNAQAAGDESAMADLQAEADSDEAVALAEAEAQARSQRMQEMYADYGNQDYGDDTQVASDIIARRGGNMPVQMNNTRGGLNLPSVMTYPGMMQQQMPAEYKTIELVLNKLSKGNNFGKQPLAFMIISGTHSSQLAYERGLCKADNCDFFDHRNFCGLDRALPGRRNGVGHMGSAFG